MRGWPVGGGRDRDRTACGHRLRLTLFPRGGYNAGEPTAVVAGASGNVVWFATVVVPALPAATLGLSSPVRTIPVGGSAPLAISGEDRQGAALSDVRAEFVSSNSAVGANAAELETARDLERELRLSGDPDRQELAAELAAQRLPGGPDRQRRPGLSRRLEP